MAARAMVEYTRQLTMPPDMKARLLGLTPHADVVPEPNRESSLYYSSRPIREKRVEALCPGTHVGRFEIIRRLGAGSMGLVFLARDKELGRRVAMKFFNVADAELRRRFVIEGRITANCIHENIVVLHEMGEFNNQPFMVLEYLKGQTFASIIRDAAPLPAGRAVELIAPVIRALICAHEHGIVHRDLKPENILLTDSGVVKVMDFGIAKLLGPSFGEGDATESEHPSYAPLTNGSRSALVGTQPYMSPEQWGVGGSIDFRTDLWAVGIILFEMLSGQHPFTVTDDLRAWMSRLDLPIRSLRNVASHVSEELVSVVDACLRKRKEERPCDARALLRALEPLLLRRVLSLESSSECSPYTGLRPFQEEDAARFFGRARETAALAMQIREQPLLTVVGPSGIGKSSFVRAGVIPALKNSDQAWVASVLRPGRDPIGALAALIAPLIENPRSPGDDLAAQKRTAARLTREPGLLGSALRTQCRRTGRRHLLFVDQLEELYTLCDKREIRQLFATCLAGVADDATSPLRVVVAIRSDFFGRVAEEDPSFMCELAKGLFLLGRPSLEGLRDAILGPAEMAGYKFETQAIVDDMLEHLRTTSGALPLLQFTALRLWETRDASSKTFTLKRYRELGGIAGALVSHADNVIARLSAELKTACKELFVQLVTPERTRSIREISDLRESFDRRVEIDKLIAHLVESRLLCVRTHEASGCATVEIAHDSLIVSWPTLRRWLDESLEDTLFLDQLRTAARQWSLRRDADLLWRGEIIAELKRFTHRFHGRLSASERAYVDAVLLQQARRQWYARLLLSGGACLTIGVLIAAVLAVVVISRAKIEAEDNSSRANRAKAEAQLRLTEKEEAEHERNAANTTAIILENRVQSSAVELAAKNARLRTALAAAQSQRLVAETALQEARQNALRAEQLAKEAASSEHTAAEANRRLEQLLAEQVERNKRLEKNVGRIILELPE